MLFEPQSPVRVNRWPTERSLLILNTLTSAGLWFVLVRSLRAAPYAFGWVAVIVLMNVAFITVIRGSAVRLGPDQMPDLYARVENIARRFGMKTPAVYLMQQDGALNAFATRFLRGHMIVLLSDLIEACGDNTAALDMIIGHELGHIRAGHLRGRWLLMPGLAVPFLGAALSRAREYTCDRYGFAAAGDRDGALLGLAILSAGGRFGPHVNRTALVYQRRDLRGAWMMVGEWMGSHPPLSKRMWALAPELAADVPAHHPVRARGLRAALAACIVVAAGAAAVSAYLPRIMPNHAADGQRRQPGPEAQQQVERDLRQLKAFIESDRQRNRPAPWDVWDLYQRWVNAHPDDDEPTDPFSGYWYDYESHGESYRIWSTGPDGRNRTADDIVLESSGGSPHRRYVSRR